MNKILITNLRIPVEIYIDTIVTGGSQSLSLGTSIQDISMAPLSPGEQGTNKSSQIISLLVGEGPETCYKIPYLLIGNKSAVLIYYLEVCSRLYFTHWFH